MVTLSDKAASEIKNIMQQNGGAFEGIRVFVAGGGCSGLSYGMQIADEPATSDDLVFDHEGVKVIVDMGSHQYLDGASIDFDDTLQGGGFKISNPNAVKTCGCGSSFATEEGAEGAEASKGGGCGGGCGSH
jgi:iron-sulfur cluster assembly accessory protein